MWLNAGNRKSFCVLPLKKVVSFCDSTQALTFMWKQGMPDDQEEVGTVATTEKWWQAPAKLEKEGTAFIFTPPGFT